MLQLGFGWHITTVKWDSILEEIKNKYGTSTIKYTKCPKGCDPQGGKFCSCCGSEMEEVEEEFDDDDFDSECFISEYDIYIDHSTKGQVFIAFRLLDLREEFLVVNDISKSFILKDELEDECYEIAKMITEDEEVPAIIFDDGYYDREWDNR